MIEEIKKMPKIELHIHLDGSVNIETARKLLGKDIPSSSMVSNGSSLTDYLTKFDLPISIMQTKDNLRLIASDLVKYLESQNVVYAEIRFAPMFHTKNLSFDEVVESVLLGFKSSKVKTNLILCMMRGANNIDNYNTVLTAKKYLNRGVCGLDLAGDESKYSLGLYEKYFKMANDLGIPFTIHSGEVTTYKEVNKAVEIGAKRIGHGIKAILNDDTINLIKEKNIHLEVCPTSNVDTKAVSSYEEHPIKDLYDKGISLSINTDNVTVSNITLNEEYIKLYKAFGFTKKDFIKMNKYALDASFITEEEKKYIEKALV